MQTQNTFKKIWPMVVNHMALDHKLKVDWLTIPWP